MGVVKNLFPYKQPCRNNVVGLLNAGELPYKCPLKGLLAFFTVVASSQISPHSLLGLLFHCKGTHFLRIYSINFCFFDKLTM